MEATRRIMKPQPVDGRLMCVIAVIGLVVNLVMGLVLVGESISQLQLLLKYLFILVGS